MNTENNNTPTQNQQTNKPTTANASPRSYDPIKGVTQEGEQTAPVHQDQLGQQRDPSVETDATAGTYDKNIRPASEVQKGEQQSIFERPLAPGIPNPTPADDPNTGAPHVP